MRKITPFLWFDDNAEEAVDFYVSVFRNSRVVRVARYGEAASKAAGREKGSVMTVEFEFEGQPFVALNGGPVFRFSPAISFSVNCEMQGEIDELWEKLSAGGEPGECGWLQDRFGVSWQIVPAVLDDMAADPDPEKSESVMRAMLRMKKIDLSVLREAYRKGKAA